MFPGPGRPLSSTPPAESRDAPSPSAAIAGANVVIQLCSVAGANSMPAAAIPTTRPRVSEMLSLLAVVWLCRSACSRRQTTVSGP